MTTTPTTYGAHAAPDPPPPHRFRRWLPLAILAGIVLIGVIVQALSSGSPAGYTGTATATVSTPPPRGVPSGVDPNTWSPDTAPGLRVETYTVYAPEPAPIAAAPSGPLSIVVPGIYEVGTGDGQVPAGKYKSTGVGGGYCAVTRLRNNDGSSDDTIDVVSADGPVIVNIAKTDGYIEVYGCTLAKSST